MPSRSSVHVRSVLGLVALAGLALVPATGKAQSFACERASGCTEQVICATPQLGALDSEMASLYYTLQANATRRGASVLLQSQRQWLASRDSCGCNANCLVGHYNQRIQLFRSVLTN